MILYFENRLGELRSIADCKTEEEVIRNIHEFIDEINRKRPPEKQFKIPYMRIWKEDEYTIYDVGSHVEFFKWENN